MSQLPSLRDNPGTKREYETIYILRPNTGNNDVATVNQRVREIIESRGGKIVKVDNWGKRRLAYEIAKERRGIYLYWHYLATPEIVAEFERNMRMLDDVIRFLTTKLDADIDPEARPGADEDVFEAAANTAADEEDLYTQHRSAGADEDGEEATEGEDEGDRDSDNADDGDNAEADAAEDADQGETQE